MRGDHADKLGNLPGSRDHRSRHDGHATHHLPQVQRSKAQQAGHLLERNIQAGRGRLALLALRLEGGIVA
jgi:hypothetical protein